ncbi:acyl-CoA dehydrogenase [Pigmentiphaga sp. NML080357]|uniref:acyl-CoA dehydrogenase family protein n=1 Tax=Pigmentiphaga sp. NML080357 TaxID=2008675 RepID=UPI000B40B103|nr:acyl-CoA dehydrogenase family protein [Pigmentiphaga sp. NML080357]OVZ60684.1 acyl-CoA dehydrogenase [Pigmentiphaga sp. NML080357]
MPAFDQETFPQLLHTIDRFIRQRLMPLERQVEEKEEVPAEIIEEMKHMGLFGLGIPEEYGGCELDLMQELQVQMAFSYTSPAFRLVFWPNVGIGSKGIVLAGTEAQKRKYLPGLASGELRAAFCLTEPDAGSDAASLKTRAERDGDMLVINGTKRFITNATRAHVFTVMARTDPAAPGAAGISAILVDRDTPGLHIGKPEKKLGQRGSPISDVIFDDVRVPVANVIGGEGALGQGFKTAMQVLDGGRISVAASALGMARRLIDEAARYALQRKQFGQPIAGFQLIQAMLADSETEYLAGHALVTQAAQALQRGDDARSQAAAAKYFCSEALSRIADRALQIHGGSGYVAEHHVERLYRDARALRIYEGTSQVLQLVIARAMLKRYED